LLHDELLERGHDPLAVINRQTDFARRKLVKSFLDPQLRPWTSPYSSCPSIVIVHSIAVSLKSAIFMKLSCLMFPIPSHPRLFAALSCDADIVQGDPP
jgi:hypothetical protein